MDGVASLELCIKLFELSNYNYDGTDKRWYCLPVKVTKGSPPELDYSNWQVKPANYRGKYSIYHYPAYTLDYLLRKLPKYLHYNGDDLRITLSPQGFGDTGLQEWCATYRDIHEEIPLLELGKTPEDAICTLAIELFKLKVLKP